MTIRSLDLQVLLPKTADVSRVQQIQDNQPQQQQQQFAAQFQQMVTDRQKQVQHSPKAEGNKISEKPERRKASSQEKQRREHKEPQRETTREPQPRTSDPHRGHIIDVKL